MRDDLPQRQAKIKILGPGDPVFDKLLAEARKLEPVVPGADEVRAMLDAELGDISLSDLLIEMRNE